MEIIRQIQNEKDQKQFINLTAYCFADETGWTEQLFPLDADDRAFGLFVDENLTSAAISKDFTSCIFGEIVPSSGIACVASGPQYRNKKHVRKLLSQVLREDYEKGRLFSALYPFQFQFYQKFGYGSIGMAYIYNFKPNDIHLSHPPSGWFVPFDGTEKQLAEMYRTYNTWVKNFDFGILLKTPALDVFKEKLEKEKDSIFIYYNQLGNCHGFIRIHLETLRPFFVRLKIKKIAWANPTAFRVLLHFLRNHRDQCQDIEWTVPACIPINWITQEPRIEQKCVFLWMARPLHVKRLLEMKARKISFDDRFIFSVQDEIIPENSGTYLVKHDKVEKQSFRDENTLPFHLFSSLLFGGISLKEALLVGLVNTKISPEIGAFFSLNRNIYLTEVF